MAMMQDLDNAQIDQAISAAVDKHVPVVLTIRGESGWANFHSRALAVRNGRLCLEMPLPQDDQPPHEFTPAEKIGISFKLKHYKHIFQATLAGVEKFSLNFGLDISVLALCLPTRMQRMQRRSYVRVDVPSNRIVRAAFWLGGRDNEPNGSVGDNPVWFGRVVNLSAGGFQLQSDVSVADDLESGDMVGVRIAFGAGADQVVYADAQFRHVETSGPSILMGFQFVGLDQTVPGRQALLAISNKVAEFQKAQDRAEASSQQ